MNFKESGFLSKTGFSSACFYPMYTEKAFDITVNTLGYSVCELFINTISETERAFLDGLHRIKKDADVRFSAIHPCFSGYESTMFFSNYKRRFYDSLETYKHFFEAAQYLGAKFVVFHGYMPKDVSDTENYYEIFAEINETAQKFNVTLCQENVGAGNAFIRSLKDTAKRHGDKIPFVYDIKHAIISETDPFGMIDIMGEDIKHIHLNDFILSGERIRKNCRLPFFGEIDYNIFFSKLLSYNYIGDFIIEVYRDNYADIAQIQESRTRFEAFFYEGISLRRDYEG